MNSTSWALSCLLAASCALSGCGKEDAVTVSEEAKQTGQSAASPAGTAVAVTTRDIAWTLPEGWKEDPTSRPMRAATLIVAEGENGTQVIVTRLSGSFGEFADNVNRWRAQVGLEPVSDSSAIKPEIIATPAGEAKLLKMEGPEQSQVVAMVKRGDDTWFFRMVGAKSVVAANEAKLRELIASLKAK